MSRGIRVWILNCIISITDWHGSKRRRHMHALIFPIPKRTLRCMMTGIIIDTTQRRVRGRTQNFDFASLLRLERRAYCRWGTIWLPLRRSALSLRHDVKHCLVLVKCSNPLFKHDQLGAKIIKWNMMRKAYSRRNNYLIVFWKTGGSVLNQVRIRN